MSGNRGKKVGVLTPTTNLTVEHDLRSMRIDSATIATARIMIDQIQWNTDDDLRIFVEGVTKQIPVTTAQLVHMQPDVLLLGISISLLWDGLKGNKQIKYRAKKDTGLDMITPVDAMEQGLRIYGAKKIGVVTPYPEIADEKVVQFFKELGVEVIAQKGLRCKSARGIGEVPPEVIRAAFQEVCVGGVDALVQLGTDLNAAVVAAQAELWLGKPVLAANTATWWCTLRYLGVKTQIRGWGSLLQEH